MVHGRNIFSTLLVRLVNYPWKSAPKNREEPVSKWPCDLSSFPAVYQSTYGLRTTLIWITRKTCEKRKGPHFTLDLLNQFLRRGLGIWILTVTLCHLWLLLRLASENWLYSVINIWARSQEARFGVSAFRWTTLAWLSPSGTHPKREGIVLDKFWDPVQLYHFVELWKRNLVN